MRIEDDQIVELCEICEKEPGDVQALRDNKTVMVCASCVLDLGYQPFWICEVCEKAPGDVEALWDTRPVMVCASCFAYET